MSSTVMELIFNLACVVGTLATIIFLLGSYHTLTYSDTMKSIDVVMNGGVRRYHVAKPFVVAVVAWTVAYTLY